MLKLTKIQLTAPSEIKDLASDFLLGLGAMATSEDNNGEYTISALFPTDVNIEHVIYKFKNYMCFLKENLKKFKIGEIRVENIDNSSWEVWKNKLKRIKASKSVYITPPWDMRGCADNEHLVVINPSMAFGTGHHETTKLCIGYIESLNNSKSFNTILDVGCGSGILSIVSVKLGVEKAICFDTDPLAIREARENIKRNKLEKRITSFCGSIQSVRGLYDIIAVNISAEIILSIKNELEMKLSPNGCLIISGILLAKKEQVAKGIIKAGFQQIDEKKDGEWIGMIFTKVVKGK